MSAAHQSRAQWWKGLFRKLLVWAFYLLIGAMLFDYARGMRWEVMRSTSPKPVFLVAGFLLAVCSRFVFFNTFRIILNLFSAARPGNAPANLAYSRSWIARYIPGKVAALVGRVFFYGQLGASHGEVVFASVVEFGLSVPVGVVVGLVGLGLSGSAMALDPTVMRFSLWAALLLPLLMVPSLINFTVGKALALTGRRHLTESLRVDFRGLTVAFAGVMMNQIVVGVVYWLVAASLAPTFTLGTLPLVAGIFCLAGAISTLAFFAPSGLGVKELLLMPFLVRVVEVETALAILVAARAVEFACDLSYLGLSWLWAGAMRRREGP